MQKYHLSLQETEGRLHELINQQCMQARTVQRLRSQLLARAKHQQQAHLAEERHALKPPPLPLPTPKDSART